MCVDLMRIEECRYGGKTTRLWGAGEGTLEDAVLFSHAIDRAVPRQSQHLPGVTPGLLSWFRASIVAVLAVVLLSLNLPTAGAESATETAAPAPVPTVVESPPVEEGDPSVQPSVPVDSPSAQPAPTPGETAAADGGGPGGSPAPGPAPEPTATPTADDAGRLAEQAPLPDESPEDLLAPAPLADIGPMGLGNACLFATPGAGPHARSLCWLDLAGFTTRYLDRGASANPRYVAELGQQYGSTNNAGTLFSTGGVHYGPISNFPVDIQLSAQYRFRATLAVSTPSVGSGLALRAVGVPTWSGAYLAQGLYNGIPGSPALYQLNGGTSAVTLSNIRVTDSSDTRIRGFSVVVADAESTDNPESITWTHNGGAGFLWLPNKPAEWSNSGTGTAANTARKQAALGNACSATPVGQFPRFSDTTATAATRSCQTDGNQASPKTGTAMLQIAPGNDLSQFSVTQTMVGGGLQAVAFGVLMGGAQLNVQVTDRVVDGAGNPGVDVFTGTLARGDGAVLGTASTGTIGTAASTSGQYFPLTATNTQLDFSAAVTGATATSYRQEWVCWRTTPESTTQTRWPSSGSSPTRPTGTNAQISSGQFLDCTVTFAPPYLTLVKVVENGATGATGTPAQFTLTATGPNSAIAGPGNAATVTTRPVGIGSYALTENPPTGGGAWQPGYTWSGLTCSGATPTVTTSPATGAVTAATVAINASTTAATCTYTNRANPRPATVTIAKQVLDVQGQNQQPASGWTVGATLSNPVSGVAISTPAIQTTGANGQVPTPWTVTFPNGGTTANLTVRETMQPGYEFAGGSCVITAAGGATRTQNLTAVETVLTGLAPGETAACTFVNRRLAGSVTWQKVDSSSPAEQLAGSQWRIVGPAAAPAERAVTDCVAVNDAACTGEDKDGRAGHFRVTGLAWGSYDLIETRPPAGFVLDATPRPFTVSATGLAFAFATPFANRQQDVPALPLTGGLSSDGFLIGGGGLLLAAASALLLLRRRRAEI